MGYILPEEREMNGLFDWKAQTTPCFGLWNSPE
jgi:hypothetical protein